MGLKKEGQGADSEKKVDPVAAGAASEPGQDPAAKAEAPKAAVKKVRKLSLLAVFRPISDPFTGVTFTENSPKLAAVSEGNWVDCQIKAGLLREYTAPVEPEEEVESE